MLVQDNEHKEDKVGILLHQYYLDIEQLDLDILDIPVEQLVTSIYTNLLVQQEFGNVKFLEEENYNMQRNHK
jgi:hypothetical protein